MPRWWNPLDWGRLFAWRWRNGHFWFLRKSHKPMPLRIYAGLPGSGKTLFCVMDAVHLLRRGERVYSNIYIKDPLTGRAAEPCMSWLELLEISVKCLEWDDERRREGLPPLGAHFVIDELQEYCDAREWERTPKWMRQIFANRRHYRIALLGTTQLVDQLEKRLRTLVDEIWDVKPTWIRVWGQSLFKRELPIFWRSTVDRRMVDRPDLAQEARWRTAIVGWEAFGAYGTHQQVTGQDLTALSDTAALAFVEDLQNRAAALLLPSEVTAFTERHAPEQRGNYCTQTGAACHIEPDVRECIYAVGNQPCGYLAAGDAYRDGDDIRWLGKDPAPE